MTTTRPAARPRPPCAQGAETAGIAGASGHGEIGRLQVRRVHPLPQRRLDQQQLLEVGRHRRQSALVARQRFPEPRGVTPQAEHRREPHHRAHCRFVRQLVAQDGEGGESPGLQHRAGRRRHQQRDGGESDDLVGEGAGVAGGGEIGIDVVQGIDLQPHRRHQSREADEGDQTGEGEHRGTGENSPPPRIGPARQEIGDAGHPAARNRALRRVGVPEDDLQGRVEGEADHPAEDQAACGPDAELPDRQDLRDRQRGEADRRCEDGGRDGEELVLQREHPMRVEIRAGALVDEPRVQVNQARRGRHHQRQRHQGRHDREAEPEQAADGHAEQHGHAQAHQNRGEGPP